MIIAWIRFLSKLSVLVEVCNGCLITWTLVRIWYLKLRLGLRDSFSQTAPLQHQWSIQASGDLPYLISGQNLCWGEYLICLTMVKSLMTALSVLIAVLVSLIPIFKQFSLPPSQTTQYPPVGVKLADETVRHLIQHLDKLDLCNNTTIWLVRFYQIYLHPPFLWMEARRQLPGLETFKICVSCWSGKTGHTYTTLCSVAAHANRISVYMSRQYSFMWGLWFVKQASCLALCHFVDRSSGFHTALDVVLKQLGRTLT